ncbi:MAG: MerR family transcriptional regulator [Pseudomonadota bacterium]
MQKSDDALRTIGEVSEALSVKPHILRYWEEQFSMLNPLKRAGGRRYYRSADIALLRRIDRLLNEEGYTIKGAHKALKNGDTQSPIEQDGEADSSLFNPGEENTAAEPMLPLDGNSSVSESMLIELRAIRSELVDALNKAD